MKELICDKFYRNGFELHHVDKLVTSRPIAVFDLKNTAKAYPSWQLAQWCCKNNLANGKERVKQDGTYEISDPSKKVTVDVEKGIISLELCTSDEYTVARREGEGWPHILLEQDFPCKPKVTGAKRILLKIDMSVDKAECCQREECKDFHTAQFSWIFVLADKSEGKGREDFIWFGCPIYDFRFPFPGEFRAKDGGKPENTGKYIYFIDSKKYLKEPVAVGRRFSLEIDVTKEMKEAIEDAKSKGFLPLSRPEDIAINNTNLGWEVTGTFDAALTFYDLSVQVEEDDEK